MKEEIEKVSGEVIDWLDPVAYGLSEGLARTLKDKIRDAILTQVEKARAEEREKISVYLEGTETWEGREFAKTIRNKLEK